MFKWGYVGIFITKYAVRSYLIRWEFSLTFRKKSSRFCWLNLLIESAVCVVGECDRYNMPTEVAKPTNPVIVINKAISITLSKLEFYDVISTHKPLLYITLSKVPLRCYIYALYSSPANKTDD